MPRKNPHAAALGRIRTPKKAKSSAKNGKKGGRPVRLHTVHGVEVHHEAAFAGLEGKATSRRVTEQLFFEATTEAAAQWLRRHGYKRDPATGVWS